ncbi:hypothetical protein SAMN06265353_1713 [Hydrogenobacter hydrogenophilus]|uniref:Uncharacterized protein n=1 Tax=Hydrogenobacter hydrogenophilus TaxID=35835 RepID=A0A285P9L1_9AQUI|nr:hypothetical protein SAMN06265353_1713 [Hydrogenobacter hydrogenophilus]
MLFVGFIVLFFSLYQLFGYFHRSGGVLPKVQAQVQQVENKSSNNEKAYLSYPYYPSQLQPSQSQRQPQPQLQSQSQPQPSNSLSSSGYYYIEVDTSAKEPLQEPQPTVKEIP